MTKKLTLSEIIKLWFDHFDKMLIGQRINVLEVGKRDPELFTDMCKAYIDGHPDYSFTNDYKFFKRDTPWPI